MEHGTTILFGLPGVGVRGVEVDDLGDRVIHVVTVEATASACPSCGVFSTSVKQNGRGVGTAEMTKSCAKVA